MRAREAKYGQSKCDLLGPHGAKNGECAQSSCAVG